jgi:drug/metabolite transporter (DMT)-like permease
MDLSFNSKWGYATFIATILFVMGQVCLKLASFHPMIIGYWFAVSMGILGFIGLISTLFTSNQKIKHKDIWYALFGGALFFFGNLLWIYAIQTAPHVSYVYILTTAIVTIAMLFIGLYLFHQSIHWINLVGIGIIIIGIYMVLYKK